MFEMRKPIYAFPNKISTARIEGITNELVLICCELGLIALCLLSRYKHLLLSKSELNEIVRINGKKLAARKIHIHKSYMDRVRCI